MDVSVLRNDKECHGERCRAIPHLFPIRLPLQHREGSVGRCSKAVILYQVYV